MAEWRTLNLEGFEHYEISDEGDVKNTRTDRILKRRQTWRKYPEYRLISSDGNKIKDVSIANLVMMTFRSDEYQKILQEKKKVMVFFKNFPSTKLEDLTFNEKECDTSNYSKAAYERNTSPLTGEIVKGKDFVEVPINAKDIDGYKVTVSDAYKPVEVLVVVGRDGISREIVGEGINIYPEGCGTLETRYVKVTSKRLTNSLILKAYADNLTVDFGRSNDSFTITKLTLEEVIKISELLKQDKLEKEVDVVLSGSIKSYQE